MNATPLPPQGPGTAGSGTGPQPDQTPWTGYGPPPGAPVPPAGPVPPRSGVDSFFDSIRRLGLTRSDERWIGGVAGGLAQRLGIDPLIVRGILAASVLLGGLGLVLYGIGWLLLPDQRDSRIHLQQLFRGDFDAAVLGGFAMFFIGLSIPGSWGRGIGDAGWWQGLVWVCAIALVVVLVTSSSSRNRAARRGVPFGPPPPPPYPPAPLAGQAPVSPYAPGPTSEAHTQLFPTTGGTPTGAPTGSRIPEGPTTTMYPTATYAPPVAPPPPGGPAPWTHQGPPNPPARAPRPPRRGPGAGTLGIVVALSLLTLAALLYAKRVGSFDGPVGLTVGAVAVVLLGIAIIVSGMRGRTGGGLGVLAVIGILSLLPLTAAYSNGWDGWDGQWTGPGAAVGDISRTPTDVATAEQGYSVGAGNARIDLTELPLAGGTVQVPVHVGAGDLTIVVPHDGAYTADISVMAGEIRWLGDTVSSGFGPGQDQKTYESQSVRDGATPDIALDITVGAGTVRVEEE
ncbi:MAG TPA: PspC domain-containing protein [Actinotalea sp.]